MALNQPSAIMVIDPAKAIADSKARKDIVVAMREADILRPGIDFGPVPGTDKDTLLKPGAERLCAAFSLDPRFDTLTAVEKWDGDEPLFFYRVMCRLIHIETGLEVATGIGSCNSREAKYRWRWVEEAKLPPGLDKFKLESRNATLSEFKFAIDKAETTGKYAKPAAYWQAFKDAIENGTARKVTRTTSRGPSDAYEIGGVQYRIPNDDVFSLVNTIDKMACKRALIAATLIGANASEFFTQDIEDMPGFGLDVIEGVYTEITEPSAPEKSGKGEPPPSDPPASDAPASWATAAVIGEMVDNALKNAGLTASDIQRFAGLENMDDLDAWNKKFQNRKAAGDAIIAAHEAEMSKLPGATPKAQPAPVAT